MKTIYGAAEVSVVPSEWIILTYAFLYESFGFFSFLLKNPEAKEDQIQVFGETAWVILANVFHPLAILFYFHSFICMAEIMHRSYTRKYIGLVRMSKQRRYSQVANRKNASNLFQVEAQSNSQ